jgi:hypothetical protein
MNSSSFLPFFNLFCSGILAGLEIATHYAIHKPTLSLEDKPQIIFRQGIVRTLRWIVPGFFIPTTLTGITITLMDNASSGFYFRLVAVLLIFIWIYLRVIGTVPINAASLEWNPDSPPKDWKEQISKAERFHIIGTCATTLAFILFLTAVALSKQH